MRTYSRYSWPYKLPIKQPSIRQAANFGGLLFLLFHPDLSLAEADGPDFWRVHDVARDDVLSIRSHADFKASKTGEIPYDAQCVKKLGCKGGLSFQEFTTLSESEKQQILKQRPRWCRISYQGMTGWVAGRYLREGSCLDIAADKSVTDHDIDPFNHTYLIEKDKVTLRHGHTREKIPGSTAAIISELIRRPVYADLTGDGNKEAASIVIQHTSGTGTFYYLVVAARSKLIESFFLGDRINIVSIEMVKDIIRVNYLDRAHAQPMSARPSLRKSVDFRLVDNALVLSRE